MTKQRNQSIILDRSIMRIYSILKNVDSGGEFCGLSEMLRRLQSNDVLGAKIRLRMAETDLNMGSMCELSTLRSEIRDNGVDLSDKKK